MIFFMRSRKTICVKVSLIDKIFEAGGSMVPLAVCSVVSIAVIIERYVNLKTQWKTLFQTTHVFIHDLKTEN